MKVHLRRRKQTKAGTISLYLEIYKGTIRTKEGKVKVVREYDYLGLYLNDKPKTPFERQQNKEMLDLAESIRARTELRLKTDGFGFSNKNMAGASFFEYFREQSNRRHLSSGNYGNWNSSLKHLRCFAGENVTFKEINEEFCERFKIYLSNNARTKAGTPLSSSSAASYFSKFKACLKQAEKENIIQRSPAVNVSIPRVIENERQYLTLEELKSAASVECRYEVLKRAFLFSCLTGLRWSDIQKLSWEEVRRTEEGWRIVFHQKKTKGLQYLDISDQAREFLGKEEATDERVFKGLKYSSYTNVALQQWMLKAGITKSITFHCARHTFAVLQLSLGTEIYTLSQLLGHKELKTTQIYARVLDEKKREAANKIPNINIGHNT